MHKRISQVLATSIIVSQMQGLAFAENTANVQEIDISQKETISQEADMTNADKDQTKDAVEENTEEKNETEDTKEDSTEEKNESHNSVGDTTEENNDNYIINGKLELDLNFAMPIKYTTTDETNISVSLKKENEVVETIKLGSNHETNTTKSKVEYKLEPLNSKKESLKSDEDTLSFYHLTFEKLELGTYSLEISGDGYETANIDNIDVTDYSKRVLVGTSDNNITVDDKEENYPGLFLTGDLNGDKIVDKSDYEELKSKIKSKSSSVVKTNTKKFDLNRDGKIDITDLSYVHQNNNKSVAKSAEIIDTDIIINPQNVQVELLDTTVLEEGSNLKDLLKDNNSTVALKTASDEAISESNPLTVSLNLATNSRSAKNTEQVVIKSPSENAPTSGSIVIPNAGEGGHDLKINFSEKNIKKSNARDAQDEIVIDLGKQVAVSEIKINVTGSRSNKNLTEIAKVEFLNNVYKEIPKPKMNIPVINYFTSSTAVGNEAMTLGWNHETNVTGYELKVQELDDKGNVKSTSTYKTSENRLKIEKVNGYSTYRVSIQSLSGDWKSGYKDEQEDYNENAVGSTNLDTNSNDKDGIADNVDANYNPKAWDSKTGDLEKKADGANGNMFGVDSIVELQVIPETAPEGPEGITIEGQYKALKVSWKSHKKAKDYDLYYRKVGTGAWIKANDTNSDYVDSNENNDIPDGVADLSPDQKKDNDELIRGTSYTITDLDDKATYEIKMTATNHHGTGGLSQTYLGSTTGINAPKMTAYKLINRPVEGEIPSSNIVDIEYTNHNKVEHPNGMDNDKFAIVDNDYKTYWTSSTWNVNHEAGPIVTFDKEYTIDTIRLATRLDGVFANDVAYDYVPVRYYDSNKGEYVKVNARFKSLRDPENKALYYEIKLPNPITTNKIQTALRINPSYGQAQYSTISEIKFYEYDSLESDVDALFKDDLMLELADDVNQEHIDSLVKRAKTIDPVNMEYHPNQKQILEDLQRAQDLLDDVNLNDEIIKINPNILNLSRNNIGQSNASQSLGVAVRPGDKVNIYISSPRKDTKFNLKITQHYAESGTAVKNYNQELVVGKNEITIPESAFDMNYEKGGNLYLEIAKNISVDQDIRVRVSGGTEIPHLNVSEIIDDNSIEKEVKDAIRRYIGELKSYVSSLPSRYPDKGDAPNNIYTYDAKTSILNTTDIEGKRITLNLAADQVLKGIQSGLSTEEEQVDRLYETLCAWEQLMKISYAQQGLIEEAIDFDGDGKIGTSALKQLNGKSEQQYFNDNKAPLNRINIKYQRMFTGAFMYASSHHVGIEYGSIAGTMAGVPFKFDSNGNLVNKDEGQLFGWGINHEIGHVHDVAGLTYAEVTNNILALISQTFDDEDLSRIEGAYDQVYDKVTSGSEGLASSGLVKLAMFWQLHLAYDNDNTYKILDVNTDNNLENDTFYAKLYRVTRENGIAPSENGHDRVAQTFIMRSSDAVGKDLREFFEKWGLVASPNTNKYLDSKAYPKEDKAIYYLNDNARRLRLSAIANNNLSSLEMAKDTKVNASFGNDKNGNKITNKTYLNQKEVPLELSVNKDSDKILGYEIIRKESTATGVKEVPCGFVERNQEGEKTTYIDVIDAVNNRAFGYEVRAYDYNLNVTEVTEIGTVKVSHDGSISKSNWKFDTNTRSSEDVADENTGHGQVENGSINKIKDNDKSTVYNASKSTDNCGHTSSADPYVTIEMDRSKSVVGMKYTPGPTVKKKFSLRKLFSRNAQTETTYSPISKYEVLVSEDGNKWTKAHSGTFDTTKENTIYFNEKGNSDNSQLWSYNAKYVKLVAKGASTLSIAELDILGPQGDNIEIGVDNNDQNYKNGVGRLASEYEYAPGKSIPAGSIIVTGEYKGDPAFNVPLVLNENDENFSIEAQAILLANLPENAQLGEVAEGNWLYWITPEQEAKAGNIEGKQIKAELYRYNKLDSSGAPVGQRLVSDTFLVDLPTNLNDLPQINLNSSKLRTLSSSYNKVVEIKNETIKKVSENR